MCLASTPHHSSRPLRRAHAFSHIHVSLCLGWPCICVPTPMAPPAMGLPGMPCPMSPPPTTLCFALQCLPLPEILTHRAGKHPTSSASKHAEKESQVTHNKYTRCHRCHKQTDPRGKGLVNALEVTEETKQRVFWQLTNSYGVQGGTPRDSAHAQCPGNTPAPPCPRQGLTFLKGVTSSPAQHDLLHPPSMKPVRFSHSAMNRG